MRVLGVIPGRLQSSRLPGKLILAETGKPLIEHTWECNNENSLVCYELTEQGDKVLLVLTHRRLETQEIVLDVSGGWHTHLNLLVDVLEGSKLRPFYKMQTQYESEYTQRLGLG